MNYSTHKLWNKCVQCQVVGHHKISRTVCNSQALYCQTLVSILQATDVEVYNQKQWLLIRANTYDLVWKTLTSLGSPGLTCDMTHQFMLYSGYSLTLFIDKGFIFTHSYSLSLIKEQKEILRCWSEMSNSNNFSIHMIMLLPVQSSDLSFSS